MMVTRRSKSRWFEDEHSQMLDPLEIDKLGTVLEKLETCSCIDQYWTRITELSRRSTDPG